MPLGCVANSGIGIHLVAVKAQVGCRDRIANALDGSLSRVHREEELRQRRTSAMVSKVDGVRRFFEQPHLEDGAVSAMADAGERQRAIEVDTGDGPLQFVDGRSTGGQTPGQRAWAPRCGSSKARFRF